MGEKLSDFHFSREHVWAHRLDDKTIHLGITDVALEALGEIVALELPKSGELVKKGQPIGVIESAKTVSDLYSPVDGEIVRVNEKLANELNQQSLRTREWMIEVRIQQTEQWETLLTLDQYLEWVKGES